MCSPQREPFVRNSSKSRSRVVGGASNGAQGFDEIGVGSWNQSCSDRNRFPVISGRPKVEQLLGDPTKARQKLGWRHRVSFQELVDEMMDTISPPPRRAITQRLSETMSPRFSSIWLAVALPFAAKGNGRLGNRAPAHLRAMRNHHRRSNGLSI